MNYDLAKQLEGAGFPKDWCGHDLGWCINPECHPTLSELLEACGDGFCKLQKYSDSWWAYDKKAKLHPQKCIGKTPEEAVAKLWLELNKK